MNEEYTEKEATKDLHQVNKEIKEGFNLIDGLTNEVKQKEKMLIDRDKQINTLKEQISNQDIKIKEQSREKKGLSPFHNVFERLSEESKNTPPEEVVKRANGHQLLKAIQES